MNSRKLTEAAKALVAGDMGLVARDERGTALPGKVIADAGIILGVKVDAGEADRAGHPGGQVIEGLDGLRWRLRHRHRANPDLTPANVRSTTRSPPGRHRR